MLMISSRRSSLFLSFFFLLIKDAISLLSQLNTEWAQVEVINLINDGSGLGFGIIGGRSTGVVVKTILPGGVADRVSKSSIDECVRSIENFGTAFNKRHYACESGNNADNLLLSKLWRKMHGKKMFDWIN